MANNDASSYTLRYNEISQALEAALGSAWLPVSVTLPNVTLTGSVTQSTTSTTSSSFQGIAGDTTLTAESGRDKGEGGSFQAAIMGNIHGSNLLETGNFVAGIIGAYDIQGTNASELPKGAIIASIFDSSTTADGIVVAEIDGSDPSGITRAGAAFKARQLNMNAGSGVNYGLDLYDTAVSGYMSSPTLPLAVARADIHGTFQVSILNGAGVPTDGVTGATFAEKGSIYIDRTNGKLYVNGGAGTLASPVWKLVTSAA